MKRYANWANIYIIICTLMLCVGALSALCYTAFFKPPYLSYPNNVFPLVGDKKVFHPGEIVTLMVARCNAEPEIHSYTITHAIRRQDGDYTILPATAAMIDPGCTSGVSYINVLPKSDLKSGRYRIIGNAQIEGTFRQFAVYWESEPFEVIGDIK